MTQTVTATTSTSLYDSIPNLDSWYECKNIRNEIVPCVASAKKSRNTSGCVSFSSAPPAVFHYEEKIEHFERPPHRRNSSSESGKVVEKTFCCSTLYTNSSLSL